MNVLAETAALLESLRGVWDEESVDELDHALQSAARALDDRADDELVLAAALHDLAHSPTFDPAEARRHDETARHWLEPRFGERVGWLAGQHVAAKRYLIATEPGYSSTLTPTSVLSLQAQGGACVDAALVAHPWWPDAVALRRYDDAAKDPDARRNGRAATIEHVLSIAERVIRQRLSG
ncbi:HD family phosphohydrolase [Mycolicibacterium sp.]|uniref:HD family phosphohydrolase n=1 Tax=Mycolicibacterium sp. TaxID=2320850 RepID=UPI001A22D7D8|nr:HD family phosphohydrolase [Mycolicibacterium sp.]MBJ7340041.1 HD family phosphohydrolase [Mycolicibacterium sp.]